MYVKLNELQKRLIFRRWERRKSEYALSEWPSGCAHRPETENLRSVFTKRPTARISVYNDSLYSSHNHNT